MEVKCRIKVTEVELLDPRQFPAIPIDVMGIMQPLLRGNQCYLSYKMELVHYTGNNQWEKLAPLGEISYSKAEYLISLFLQEMLEASLSFRVIVYGNIY